MISLGQRRPRDERSRNTPDQLSVDSRWPGATNRNRAHRRRQVPFLPVSVPVSLSLGNGFSLRFPTTQEFRDFLDQKGLHPFPDLPPKMGLQSFEREA